MMRPRLFSGRPFRGRTSAAVTLIGGEWVWRELPKLTQQLHLRPGFYVLNYFGWRRGMQSFFRGRGPECAKHN